MNKTTYLLKNTYQLWGMAGRFTDAKGRLLACPFADFDVYDPVSGSSELLHTLLECGQEAGDRYGSYNDEGFWYYVFHDTEGFIIWGPVIFEEHSDYEKRLYCKKHGVHERGLQIPLMNIWRFREVITFVHGLLFAEYEQAAVFDNGEDTEQIKEELYPRVLEYGLASAEYGMEHHSFADEKKFYKWLIEGEPRTEDEEGIWEELPFATGTVGIMAQSRRKDVEYGTVAGITLATRYAIAAGVQESKAYALSDVTLQTIAEADSAVEMFQIMEHAMQEFRRLGREAKAESEKHSRYVEQSRDYIARHIYEKLSLQEVAEHVGVHKGYLSRIFSRQMKMTLTDYIMKEKVQISCNLLKYSNRSIAIIAEYVNLSPQSYFTRVFKNVTGATPARYRQTHADKNFIEN